MCRPLGTGRAMLAVLSAWVIFTRALNRPGRRHRGLSQVSQFILLSPRCVHETLDVVAY